MATILLADAADGSYRANNQLINSSAARKYLIYCLTQLWLSGYAFVSLVCNEIYFLGLVPLTGLKIAQYPIRH